MKNFRNTIIVPFLQNREVKKLQTLSRSPDIPHPCSKASFSLLGGVFLILGICLSKRIFFLFFALALDLRCRMMCTLILLFESLSQSAHGGAMYFAAADLMPDLGSVNIGSLALLVPLIQKLKIAEIIDRIIPTEAEYSHGSVLAPLLAARLQSPTALVNISEWAKNHGSEILFNVPPEKLNDDRLARALDAFYEHRYAIIAEITSEVLRQTNVTLDSAHFDTTHLVFYGSYDTSVPRPESTLQKILDDRGRENLINDISTSPSHISHGYLTKYRMLQFGATSFVDDLGAVPIACHVVDGNRNGHVAIHQQYQIMLESLRLSPGFLLVSDRGTCSVSHFATLHDNGHYALCAGPWQDYGHHFDTHFDRLQWEDASYMSLEQQRRRETNSSLPLDLNQAKN